jgi:hypothetical protein
MKKIPTVGDIVVYFPDEKDELCRTNYLKEDEGIPALVTRTFGPDLINLMVFPDCGVPACKTSVHKAKVFGKAEFCTWNWPEKI